MQVKISAKEIALVVLVLAAVGLANLPEAWAARLGVNVDYLIATLVGVTLVGLLLYLKFTAFLVIVLLAFGAGMPGHWANRLGISQVPLVLALIAMVGFSLINYVVRMLPSGLEKDNSKEAQKALFYAIEKGNMVYAQKLLNMNLDPNLKGPSGYTPLIYAAARGHKGLVELFLRNGADIHALTEDGDSAVEMAMKMGHSTVADSLKQARIKAQQEAAARKAGTPSLVGAG
jgi:Ankyrin repeats (3 copies)